MMKAIGKVEIMTCECVLSFFIHRNVKKTMRRRYMALLETKKGKIRFLHELDHRFGSHIVAGMKSSKLPHSVWKSSCYMFTSQGAFGQYWTSMEVAYEKAALEGGWLIVEGSGRGGIFRPEDTIDDEIFIGV